MRCYRLAMLQSLIVLGLLCGSACLHAAEGSKADKEGTSVDDELLQKLDESVGEKPEPKPDSTTPPAKKSPQPSTDDELLKELDSTDDPATTPNKDKPSDDLGQQADPLTRIGTKMRHAETLIDREKLSDQTTLLQDEIVKDIDELLKQLKKKMQQQQQQQSNSQSQRQQQSSRSSVKPQGKQAQQSRQQQSQKGGTGDQQANKPASESDDRVRKDENKQVKLDPAAQEELLKRVWGLLPEKDREQMRQAAGDQFLPEYESLIIRYFRRLAEENDKQP